MFYPNTLFIADGREIDVCIFLEEKRDEFLKLWIGSVVHNLFNDKCCTRASDDLDFLPFGEFML